MDISNDFAVLILSCDKLSDIWPIALAQFKRHFPDCPFKIYFGSNTQIFDDPAIIPILSGEDTDWSSSYLSILQQIPEKKLFILLEDLIVASHIDLSKFMECVEFLESTNAKHIKYWPYPTPDRAVANSGFLSYEKGAPYRATVCGFWDRECLQKLLIPGENPWNFEILGSYRTAYMDGFYGVDFSLFNFVNLIEKGQWIPESIKLALNMGIVLDLKQRNTLKGGGSVRSYVQKIIFNAIVRVPWRYRVAAMNFFRKLLISY